MMADAVCNLHTGYQGHGKTLMTLAHVDALHKSSGRPVFYSGIRDCTLEGWTEFGGPSKDPARPWMTDASEWFKLPPDSIIVIDEAQRLFRPRGNGSITPPWEAALETLRHVGHTLFLITQMPRLLSSHVRALCGVHRHYMRKFGSAWVTCHEWAGVRDNCDKTRKDSISSEHRYPKAYYAAYTSAEKHSVKFGLPLKIKLALLLPVALVALAWWVFWGRHTRAVVVPDAVKASQAASSDGTASSGRHYRAPQSAQATLISNKPRIAGLPYTAPRYDELTAPVRVPVIVGCWIQAKDGGEGFCITQQGSRLMLPREFMAQFIERGMFVDFDPGPPLGDAAASKSSDKKRSPS
jgi:zona occludens toxin